MFWHFGSYFFLCWCNNGVFHQSCDLNTIQLHCMDNEYRTWTLSSETRKITYLLFRYFCKKKTILYMNNRWRSSYHDWRVGIPLTGSAPPPLCACPKPEMDFQRHMLMSFCFQLRWGVIVRVVDIGEIDEHHCLNFHFII